MTVKIELEYENFQQVLDKLSDLGEAYGRAMANTLQAEDKLRAAKNQNLPFLADPSSPHTCWVSEKLVKALLEAVEKNQKIQTIKCVREMTGLGLKETKDLVEACIPSFRPDNF